MHKSSAGIGKSSNESSRFNAPISHLFQLTRTLRIIFFLQAVPVGITEPR